MNFHERNLERWNINSSHHSFHVHITLASATLKDNFSSNLNQLFKMASSGAKNSKHQGEMPKTDMASLTSSPLSAHNVFFKVYRGVG